MRLLQLIARLQKIADEQGDGEAVIAIRPMSPLTCTIANVSVAGECDYDDDPVHTDAAPVVIYIAANDDYNYCQHEAWKE